MLMLSCTSLRALGAHAQPCVSCNESHCILRRFIKVPEQVQLLTNCTALDLRYILQFGKQHGTHEHLHPGETSLMGLIL